jgi:putative transposase
LTTQLNWLNKKNLASTSSRNEHLAMIERTNNRLPLKTQAELLSVSRSSLYYQPKAPSVKEVQAKRRIDEIYTVLPFLGSRKITVLLRKEMRISRPTVQHHMRERGLRLFIRLPGSASIIRSIRSIPICCGTW